MDTLRIIDDCLLFDTCTGKFQTINESAVFLFKHLKQGTPTHQLPEVLSQRYNISQAVAERDVELFLNDLQVIR